MADEDRGLEKLEIWVLAIALAKKVYLQVLPKLPDVEKWELGTQTRRAASSIPANIAEGYGRFHYLDSIRFFYVARGSLEELFSHLTLMKEIGYLSPAFYNELYKDIHVLKIKINGYIRFLKNSKRGSSSPETQTFIREYSEIPYDLDDIYLDNEMQSSKNSVPELSNTELPNTQLPDTNGGNQ